MKKLIILTLTLLGLSTIAASAANGDAVGNIYSTDIRAYINGVEVPSYNIGGRTAVVIEDITDGVSYNDDERKLTVSLSPEHIIEGKSEISARTGIETGKIYETDIQTVMYEKEIPSYNIGGKTAVAIEDIGGDHEFSFWGGRYVWDEYERTINLEFLYEDHGYSKVLREHQANMTVTANDDLTEGYADIEGEALSGGGELHYKWPEWADEPQIHREGAKGTVHAIFPITADINGEKEIIGYYFRTPRTGYTFTAFQYFYHDKLAEAAANARIPARTREDIISFYEGTRSTNGILARLDTDDYSFVYMIGAAPNFTSHYILRIENDGTYHNYADDIEGSGKNGQKYINSLTVDEENEKCSFKENDTEYIIDLKTGEMTEVN